MANFESSSHQRYPISDFSEEMGEVLHVLLEAAKLESAPQDVIDSIEADIAQLESSSEE